MYIQFYLLLNKTVEVDIFLFLERLGLRNLGGPPKPIFLLIGLELKEKKQEKIAYLDFYSFHLYNYLTKKDFN